MSQLEAAANTYWGLRADQKIEVRDIARMYGVNSLELHVKLIAKLTQELQTAIAKKAKKGPV